MIIKKVLFNCVFVLVFVLSPIFAQEKKPAVEIHRSEVFNIKAKSNGATYPVYIAIPGSYNYTDRKYPVVFMLDAYSSFGIMVQAQRLLAYSKEVPEAIIVGISSEGGSKEFVYNRSRDYTPTEIDQKNLPESMKEMIPVSGGAKKFLNFIMDELIPFVEAKYRCENNERTLVGHSLGGLFCFYTLFTNPEIFNKYVIISPALAWDNEVILKMAKKYFDDSKQITATIYSAVGELEDKMFIDPWSRLMAELNDHPQKGIKIKSEIAKNETHYTIIPYICTHGLTSVFKVN